MMLKTLLCFSVLLPQDPSPITASQGGKFESVVVIGASMSAGFGLSSELGTTFDLSEFLTIALEDQIGTIHGYGDTRFFQQPRGFGQKQVQKSMRSDPTMVIALDFPFWYGYGYMLECNQRVASLKLCLAELNRFDCPVLVGDFPDMTPALQGSSPHMGGDPLLARAQIPDAECRLRLNNTLHEWAAGNANRHVFPLSKFVDEVRSEAVLEFRGNQYDHKLKQSMLQSDLLHPTAKGAATATLLLLDSMVEAGWLDAETINWDAKAFDEAILEKTRPARERKAARRLKREEKKRARKAKSEEEAGGLQFMPCS